MEIIWKPFPDSRFKDTHEVSNHGRVRRKLDGYIYAERDDRFGYMMSHITYEGKSYYFRNHRLVAAAFLVNTGFNPDGTPLIGKPEINHKDSNPSNNCVNNLEYCDRHYNNSRQDRVARQTKSRSHSNYKIRCVETGVIYASVAEAARKLNLSAPSLNKAVNPNYNQKTSGGYHWEYIK